MFSIKGGYSFYVFISGSVKAPAKTEDLIQSVLTGKYSIHSSVKLDIRLLYRYKHSERRDSIHLKDIISFLL